MTQNLLLFSIGTTTWGVGDQDITAVTAARPLHHLPLSPPSVAGMALIDEKAITVFDLGACLGAPPLAEPHKGSFLLITRDDRTTAFAVAGKVDRLDNETDKVVPLPASARSAVVENCLVRKTSIIPIINMQNLLERVKQGNLDVPLPRLPSAGSKREMPVPSSVLVVALVGEKFCVDAANADYSERLPGEITALPYARQLAGIVPQGQDVVPVMSLSERIGLGSRSSGGGMIITEIDGQRCGLPVDGEEGRRENVTMLELPPVVRPGWSQGAVVENGEVIPLVDLSSVGSPSPLSRNENYLAEQYHPASAFPGLFRKGSVEVIELSLFGTCHAVPKDEVAEVLPFLPFRRLTQVPEIVLGVAELKGRLLPVLDLEAIFGRRSPVSPKWKMLRITNGDFEALVVIETVLGGKELPQDMQRQVPIAIPHQVLYGCYLDGSAVRLILNVEALAVHFEKTEIREFIAGMSPAIPVVVSEPKKERAGTVLPAEPATHVSSTSQTLAAEQPAPSEMHVSGDSYKYTSAGAGSRWNASSVDKEAVAKAQAAAEEERSRTEVESKKHAEEEARERAEAEAKAKAEAQEKAEAEARMKTEEEARLRAAEEERSRREAELRQRAEQEARERVEAEARAKAEDEVRRQSAEEERQRGEESERQRAAQEAREQQEARERAQAEEEVRRREAEEVLVHTQTAAESRQRAEERLREVIAEEFRGRPEAGMRKAGPVAGSSSSEQGVHWKWPVAAALAVIAIIALLLYLTGKAPDEVGKSSGPVKHADRPAPAPATVEPKAEVKKEPEAPLYLNVPSSMPKPETVIYVVVKGDTLWGIAKRFTGNPYNYPRVARDNSIATPDLIFPGQKIKLIQEKK